MLLQRIGLSGTGADFIQPPHTQLDSAETRDSNLP